MKILMINKFLHHVGGSETYMFRLGEYLVSKGHYVEYFGMEHAQRQVGNRVNEYTREMDFHDGSLLDKLSYPFRTVYSVEARRKLRCVLDDFCPDVCHLNNFNYQLTPSVILEIKKWNKDCRIVYTAHDYQLVCPNHMCNNPTSGQNCEKCLNSSYFNCVSGKCIHGSFLKSFIGFLESSIWHGLGVYENLDSVICCSEFLKSKLDTDKVLRKKTVAIHNFINKPEWREAKKGDYILYFGRYSKEKGINSLINVAKRHPELNFVFAGSGPLKSCLDEIDNITDVGFKSGAELQKLIREALFSIYPSMWYENCPFSVMESQMYGTPVLGARIGGIPELIEEGKTGMLFESGNEADLEDKLLKMMSCCDMLSLNCRDVCFETMESYYSKLMDIYRGNRL